MLRFHNFFPANDDNTQRKLSYVISKNEEMIFKYLMHSVSFKSTKSIYLIIKINIELIIQGK